MWDMSASLLNTVPVIRYCIEVVVIGWWFKQQDWDSGDEGFIPGSAAELLCVLEKVT